MRGTQLTCLLPRRPLLRVAAAVAIGTAACHEPEQPPASPPPAPFPAPTNPSTGRMNGRRVATDQTVTIDASIESDGGSVDARVFQLDTGASR